MSSALNAERLLRMWEGTWGRARSARADALLENVANEPTQLLSLSERNIRLLRLHAELFGSTLDMLSHCPTCETVTQFSADIHALTATMQTSADPAQSYVVEFEGYIVEFRLPSSVDIAASSAEIADDDFVAALLLRCVLASTLDGKAIACSELSPRALKALSQRMESLDPGASVTFALECPECESAWTAMLDAGEVLWQKVRAAAERILLDVDTLARAYGWTEKEVLRLNPLRRAAYLQLVTIA